MGKPKVKKSEETNRQFDSDTKCSSKQQTAEKGNEWPDWLPDGWDMEVRTRKSGPLMGSGYKCYIDSLNGNKFYSKPEVLRYLETTKGNNCTSKKKKFTRTHFPSKEGEKHINKHSPSKEEEKRTNKHSPSKEDEKCTNKHSTSKEEAKCNDKHSPNKEEEKCTNSSQHSPNKDGEKCINMHSPSNAVGEKSTVEDLPLGWIKEVKIRKNGNGIKKDWFYTDPVSGYVFRSKMDVLRYLESGDIGKCAIKPSRSQYQDEDILTPSPAAKRQKPKQSTPLQKIVAKELVDRSSLELPDVNNSRKGRHVNVPSEIMVARNTSGGSVVKMHSLEDGAANSPEMKKTSEAVLKYESLKVNHSNNSISKNNFNVGHRFSRRLAGIEPVKLADNVINDQTLLFPKRNLRKNRTTLGTDMENKSSQHFNGVTKIEQPEAMNTGQTISEVVFKEQPHQLEKDKTEGNKPEIHTNSNKSSKKKELLIPCRASKRLAGSERGLMNSIFCEKASKYKSQRSKEVPAELQQSEGGLVTECTDHAPINGESGNKRRKSPKVLPVADNQLEKLEADDEKSEPPLSFAFHYSWSDPCLEFAINTLTGVLPPIENSVDNRSSTVLETDIQKPPFDNSTGSRGSQNNSVDNGPTTIHETDIQKTLFDKVTVKKDSQNNSTGNVTRSRDKNPLVQSNKSKRKKEAKVPMRLSKRLAGLEPEASPSDKALEYSSRKSCKEEPSASATVLLTNGASHHLYAGEETKLTHNESDSLKPEVVGESSRKRSKSYDAQTVPKEQHLEKVEAKSIGDDRSKHPLPFGESWSDPCLEFAFKTLTGALPVDSAAQIFKVTTPDVNDPPNSELHGRAKTSINGKARDNSNQSQNKKGCNMNGQPSELLLGQLELRTSSISGKNVPKFNTGESHSHESNIIRNLFEEPLYVDDPRNNELHGRVTTSINGKSHDNSNQSQNKKEHNMNGQPSELLLGQPELRTSSISSNNVPKLTTEDSHSHESNIIRSLFGEYVDDPPNNELHGRATTIINGEAHDNSNPSQIKKERNMDGQPSELLLGQPELRTTSISGEDVPKFTTGESHNHESNIIRSLFGEPLYVEAGNPTQLLHHPRTNGNSQIHEEPIKNNGQVAEGEFRTTEPPSPLQTETLNHDNAELQFCESFMNSWSDPCLEFAFKTLTGVIPVEENLAIQGSIEEPANFHEGRDGGLALPDFGSSSFSQSDFSFHYDTGVNPMPGQQSSMSSSFPSLSLHGCSGVDPQQQYSQCNINFQRR
ncbi:uncharacterized protein [Cicer arietinum]|uniref:Uncharacterized protein LOC101511357 n=1 Tax=Cicer arietinum TaxID=3827 RepID=A0A1S2YFX7_CICAR|nr:uncharacterized protein LOC101511357 [Cicer arietinum]